MALTLRSFFQPWTSMHRWRRRIRLRRLSHQIPCRVIVGAGGSGQEGWISTDIDQLNLLQPRDWQFCFRDKLIDSILAEHVWEHLTEEQGLEAARTCFRFLKLGGYLRVAVPDGFHPHSEYIQRVRPGGTGPGAEDHKVLYTHETLPRVFQRAGFTVMLLEHFDAQGEFHARSWETEAGMIQRSRRFDPRNDKGQLRYTSLILDAKKTAA